MTEPLAGLSSDEQRAARAAAQVTGSTATAHDIGGRQGAVDVTLTYADGREGALEVTLHAEKGTQERDSILRDEQYQWPNPGLWDWSIRLGPSARIAELKPCYGRIIALCEEAGVTSPRHLPWALRDTDPDVRWLIDHPGRDDEPDAGGIGPHPAEPCVGARRLLSRASTFSEGPVTDSGLGRVDLLFKLLTRLGLNTPDGLHPRLDALARCVPVILRAK